jgi:RNA polymerase sigma factor (sigma-70 family)
MEEQQGSKQGRFVDTMMPYSDQLHSYAYYLTGQKEQAADLLQETFLKAYRFFDSFETGSNAKAWLYTIMKNTFINNYRQTKRIPSVVEFNEEIYDHRDSNVFNQFGGSIEHTLSDDVVTALASLPEKFKSIIILRDIEDMPYEEIAEVLDIPIGTVRSRLHRARAILFSRLKSYAKSVGYEVSNRFNGGDLAMAQ